MIIAISAMLVYAGPEKEFKKNLAVPPDAIVSVHNVNGDINIESWDKNEINIYAKIGASSDEALNNVEIKVIQTGNHLEISTKYGEDQEHDFWSFIKNITKHLGHMGHTNIDYWIKAPLKTNFDKIESVNGDVNVKKISGEVSAETVNGSIEFSELNSRIAAETVNGSIIISVNGLGGDIDCETVNGSIKVYIPGGSNAHLIAENVNGSIKSDFAVTINERITHKKLEGDVGQFGKTVKLETVNGSIYLLKLENKGIVESK